jgi:deoxyribodipyrimidine photo-lyase
MRTIDSDAVKGLEGSVADLESLSLLPHVSEGGWNDAMIKRWDISEQGALDRFEHFVQHGLKGYKEDRNRPDLDHVSMLSPYLHNGQISVRYLWHRVQALRAENDIPEKDADHFLSELGWREFSYNLLYNNHTLPEQNLQGKFDAFPWADPENDQYAAEALQKWQEGMTGYPIVDAGMRQLYATGWMHNRVRMIVGSFLVKHLLLHWHHGEAWFWDCLVDADLANNAASWQWIAGSGADAAPYFRIFNPMTQGKKFDPNADYVRQWVPELKDLPDKHIHTPWEAPDDVLKLAGVQPGKNYPKPIVDHFEARDRALEAFQSLKKDAA